MTEDLTRVDPLQIAQAQEAEDCSEEGDVEACEGGAGATAALPATAGPVVINQPPPGTTVPVTVLAGQLLILGFDPSLAQARVDEDGNLVLTFSAGTADEARLVFLGLAGLAEGDNPPVLQFAGVDIGSDVLIARVVALAPPQPDLHPMAAASMSGPPGPIPFVRRGSIYVSVQSEQPDGVVGPILLPEVRTVASAFLPPNTEPAPNFAFIGYLLFPNRFCRHQEQRRAAAAAFLYLFEEASAVNARGIALAKMAVFFAPVTDEEAAIDAQRELDVERFLDIYDYRHAEWIAKRLGLDIEGVYLVGNVPWLSPDGRVELLQLNLSEKSPEGIKAALLALKKEFTIAAWEEAAAGDTSVLTIMRHVFDSLGRLVAAVQAVAAEPTEPCL